MRRLVLVVFFAAAVAVFCSVTAIAGQDNASPYIGTETDDSSSTSSDSSSGGSVATGSISG